MHTRYSPIRHSHGAEAPIPSDLHVLSLPLAFILSQDQTLHCRNCWPAPARRPVVSFAPATLLSTFCSSFFSLHCLKDPPLRPPPPRPPAPGPAGGKGGGGPGAAPTPSAQPPVPVESEGKDRAFPGPRQILPPTFFSPAPRRSAKAPMNLRGSRRGRPENFFRARPPPRPGNAPWHHPQGQPRGRNTRAF